MPSRANRPPQGHATSRQSPAPGCRYRALVADCPAYPLPFRWRHALADHRWFPRRPVHQRSPRGTRPDPLPSGRCFRLPASACSYPRGQSRCEYGYRETDSARSAPALPARSETHDGFARLRPRTGPTPSRAGTTPPYKANREWHKHTKTIFIYVCHPSAGPFRQWGFYHNPKAALAELVSLLGSDLGVYSRNLTSVCVSCCSASVNKCSL